METSASFDARSAPSSYPNASRCLRFSRNLREIPAFGRYSSSVGLNDCYFSATASVLV